LIKVFDTTAFELSYSKKAIPKSFKKHFETVDAHKFTVADPEENWRTYPASGLSLAQRNLDLK